MLGIDKLCSAAQSQPAKAEVYRAWRGINAGIAALEGWTPVGESTILPMAGEGMCRSHFFQKPGDANAPTKQVVQRKVFVGVSKRAAIDMALRQMSLSSMPLDMYAKHWVATEEGPGDFAVCTKNREGKVLGVVMFVRDNVAVRLHSWLPGLAEGIDEDILQAKQLSREEYEALLPLPVVTGAHLDMRGGDRQYGRMSVGITGLVERPGLVVEAVQQGGANGTFSAKEGRFEFARLRGRESRGQKFGIVVYDRETLLSRWIMGDIPEANPGP